jgi:hypothetical protein
MSFLLVLLVIAFPLGTFVCGGQSGTVAGDYFW